MQSRVTLDSLQGTFDTQSFSSTAQAASLELQPAQLWGAGGSAARQVACQKPQGTATCIAHPAHFSPSNVDLVGVQPKVTPQSMRGKPWPPANMSPMHLASMLQSPTGFHSPNGGSSALAGLFTPEWAKRKLGEGGTPQSAPSGSTAGTGGFPRLCAAWRLLNAQSLPAECATKANKPPLAGILLGQEQAGEVAHTAKELIRKRSGARWAAWTGQASEYNSIQLPDRGPQRVLCPGQLQGQMGCWHGISLSLTVGPGMHDTLLALLGGHATSCPLTATGGLGTCRLSCVDTAVSRDRSSLTEGWCLPLLVSRSSPVHLACQLGPLPEQFMVQSELWYKAFH